MEVILPILKTKFSSSWQGLYFDCMPANAEQIHGVVETENISQHEYDSHAIEINHNQLFSWIGGRNPEDFQFIGFLETANSSIVRCAAALGWAYVPKFPKVNETNKGNFVKVSSNEREFLKSKNKEELLWIKKAQKIFQ